MAAINVAPCVRLIYSCVRLCPAWRDDGRRDESPLLPHDSNPHVETRRQHHASTGWVCISFYQAIFSLACLDQPPEEKELADKVASSLLDESTPPNTLTSTSKWLFTNWTNHSLNENANESCYSHFNLHGAIDSSIGVGHNQLEAINIRSTMYKLSFIFRQN